MTTTYIAILVGRHVGSLLYMIVSWNENYQAAIDLILSNILIC